MGKERTGFYLRIEKEEEDPYRSPPCGVNFDGFIRSWRLPWVIFIPNLQVESGMSSLNRS
jgi:hypothetical protein